MPSPIRVDADTTPAELTRMLTKCAAYPQSAQRTRSTDVLLDLWLEQVLVDHEVRT